MANQERKNEGMGVHEAGQKGGEAHRDKYTSEERSKQGKQAADTVEKKDPSFHSKIGQKGGENSHKNDTTYRGPQGR